MEVGATGNGETDESGKYLCISAASENTGRGGSVLQPRPAGGGKKKQPRNAEKGAKKINLCVGILK